jgi:hypothetical protein
MISSPDNTFAIGRYAICAVQLISEHPIVLWVLVLISFANAAVPLLRDSALFLPATVLLVLLSTVATPIFYGLYYQLLDDSYTSLHRIAKSYIAPYLWLLIRMYLPAILLASLPAILLAAQGSGGYLEIGLIAFSMLYLYVIPFFI